MASAEHSFTVPADATGARLDKWLADVFAGQSRSRLKALITEGAVAVGGKAEFDPARKLKAGQRVTVIMPPARDAVPEAQAMDLAVVYEDSSLIVIDKPAGLVVHPAPGNPDRTLVNALLAHCGDSLAGIGGVRRPGIVHRIDKDTSGLLVVAKTEGAHAALSAQFKAHTIARLYDAFVWGVPKPASGDITGAIGRSPRNRKKMALVKRGGKEAQTHYATVRAFPPLAAHLRCRLATGRTHQIRVHLASLGHGLIGDQVYGARARNLGKLDAATLELLRGFPRQALHAATLGFVHPVSGKDLRFESPLPADLKALQQALSGI
ncbi:MAG: RluA family pseudouridine synthase [Rhodospirillaceae bacterium]